MEIVNLLALGGGVDSTALALIDANREKAGEILQVSPARLNEVFAPCRAWAFSDTGAEFAATYDNITNLEALALRSGKRLVTVRKGEVPGTGRQETITEWLRRLGTVPLMPGGSHICSLKFKGEPLQRWAEQQFAGAVIRWAVGIEADEDNRAHRFTQRPDAQHQFDYPLRELGLTRQRCEAIIEAFNWGPVRKSSCQFCPFMKTHEIVELMQSDGAALAEEIEANFAQTSAGKFQAWLDAGMPTNKAGRAPAGMWRRDSWKDGARLFAQTLNGRKLTVEEWRAYSEGGSVALAKLHGQESLF